MKILFISNISNRFTNFIIPSINVAQAMNFEFHAAANYSKFDESSNIFGVKVHHINFARNPLHPQNFKAYKQLLKLMKEEKFDAIHCNTPVGGLLGRLCAKQTGVKKIIYTAHGFHFYKGAPLLNWLIYYPIERILAHFTDAIITITHEDFEMANKFHLRKGGRFYYVPGVGVDTSVIAEAPSKRNELLAEIGADENSVLIISAGELNQNKNNGVIIDALGKLQNKNIHYILCGVGNLKDSLAEKAKTLGIENNVHFLGYRTDIKELLKSVDIFVMPSFREGLSRSIMEAMAGGLPCVVSKIRGNIDLIDDNGGFTVAPTNIDGFAEAIEKLVTDSDLRKKMGEYNISAVQKCDIQNIKKEIHNIYSEVLG